MNNQVRVAKAAAVMGVTTLLSRIFGFVRDMVVASLLGQDQERAALQAEMSIENAKRLFEQHQEEMDRTLGKGDQSEDVDVPMPRLMPAKPSMTVERFVLDALEAEGCSISSTREGLFTIRSKVFDDERKTFDEKITQRYAQSGVFLGRVPALYQPGKPAFERLVQRWIDRSSAMITDLRKSDQEIERIAIEWVSSIPGASFVGLRQVKRVECFTGRFLCRTRVFTES